MTRYFKIKIKNKFKKDKDNKIVRTDFEYPDGWNSNKISVKAYKKKQNKGMEWCIIEINDKEQKLIDKLLQSNDVKEINQNQANARIKEARPDVHIIVYIHPKADEISPGIKTEIQNFFTSKNLKYIIK